MEREESRCWFFVLYEDDICMPPISANDVECLTTLHSDTLGPFSFIRYDAQVVQYRTI
jgi:hypothetical protein